MFTNVAPSVDGLTVAVTSMEAVTPGAIDAIVHVGLVYEPSPTALTIVS